MGKAQKIQEIPSLSPRKWLFLIVRLHRTKTKDNTRKAQGCPPQVRESSQ